MQRSGCLLGKFPLRTQLPSWQEVETQEGSTSPNPEMSSSLTHTTKNKLRSKHTAALNDLQISRHTKLMSSCFTSGEAFREEDPFLPQHEQLALLLKKSLQTVYMSSGWRSVSHHGPSSKRNIWKSHPESLLKEMSSLYFPIIWVQTQRSAFDPR